MKKYKKLKIVSSIEDFEIIYSYTPDDYFHFENQKIFRVVKNIRNVM